MGFLVYFLVPETKGKTLEGMDEVFGSAYGEADGHEIELGVFRRERGMIDEVGECKGKEGTKVVGRERDRAGGVEC